MAGDGEDEAGRMDRMVAEAAHEFAPVPAALAEARAAVREWAAASVTAEQGSDLLQLVVSELVTNAIKHGVGPVTLRLRLDGDAVTVGVHDHGRRLPERRDGAHHVPDGRGLGIVEQVARSWEVLPDGSGGKTVWVTMPVVSSYAAGSG